MKKERFFCALSQFLVILTAKGRSYFVSEMKKMAFSLLLSRFFVTLHLIIETDKSEFMDKIKIHVLRTGEVRVSPCLPFGGDDCSLLKASGITTPKSKWIWLPVFSFLMEHPKGLILFDTGWHREMSPDGVPDIPAYIGLALIMAGVIVINLFSKMEVH